MKKTYLKSRNVSRRIFLRQCGSSLLEALAYLGVAALVILGAISLLMGAFSGASSNRSSQEVEAIHTGVKKLYVGQSSGYGTGSLNASLILAKVFPSTLAISGTNVSNAWNGAVSVTGATSEFTLSYAGVPQDVCINVVTGGGDWLSVSVNGGTAMVPPITPAQATTACTSASSNSIVWTGN